METMTDDEVERTAEEAAVDQLVEGWASPVGDAQDAGLAQVQDALAQEVAVQVATSRNAQNS